MKVAAIQIQANDIKDFEQASVKLMAMVEQAAANHDLVIVPECAFPAYYLEAGETNLSLVMAKGQDLLNKIKTIAQTTGTYIAYGYAEPADGTLYNTALLMDRNGNEVLKKRKSYLWHFDHLWFGEGEDLAIADTEFGRVGLVICCDARSPEIVRLNALAGAELIIDLANLTATGANIAELHNAQSAYMLSVRALENGVWLAVSDKWGVEADSIVYTGRSAVYGPDGVCYYQACSDADEIVSVIIPTGQDGRIVRKTNKPLPERRPALYRLLAEPTDALPIKQVIEQPVKISEITPYVTTAAGEFSAKEYIEMVRRMSIHGSKLICMPPSRLSLTDLEAAVRQELSGDAIVVATMLERDTTRSYIIDCTGLLATYTNAHHSGHQPFVFAAPWGNIGILHDEEGLIPEWSRVLMLSGADCLIWPNSLPTTIATPVARTRAAENRIFIVVAQAGALPGLGQIIDPNGAIVASTLQSQPRQACGAYTCYANSRMKNIVPGTHVVFGRRPKAYMPLVETIVV
ncbi:MAG: nitrilase-related carbon-nitrogen hydrolase [Sporomusa sp.]